jgi:hypothetical protein
MERRQIIIMNYSQSGHSSYNEDTWSDSRQIVTAEDMLVVCKYWHKESASTFNDYPYGGLFAFSNLSFEIQNIIIDDSGEVFKGNLVDCKAPDFIEQVQIDFNTWIDSIKERLPRLREARRIRLLKESELLQLKKLSEKYSS